MPTLNWSDLKSVDGRELSLAKNLALNGVQWLARISKSYDERPAPGGVIELAWGPRPQSLTTLTFSKGLSLELRLPEMQLQFAVDGTLVPHVLDMDGRTPAAVEAWVLVELLHHGIDRSRFSKALPHRAPGLMEGDGSSYDVAGQRHGLQALTAWLVHARTILGVIGTDTDSDVRLDAATLESSVRVRDTKASAKDRASMKTAFSFGDGANAQPYFYVATGKPAGGPMGQSAVILPAAQIFAERMKPEDISSYLRSAMER